MTRLTRAGTLSVGGFAFNISSSSTSGNVNFISIAKAMPGQDITTRFTRTAADYPLCKSSARYASSPICSSGSPTDCVLSQPSASTLSSLKLANTTKWEGYSWDQVANLANYIVIDGLVLNMNPYIAANPKALANDTVDTILRRAFNNQSSSGKDLTLQFHARQELRDAIPCLTSRYLAGRIDKMTPGCFVAALFLYASLIVILSVVLIRFFMALIFNWFLSTRLVKKHAKRGAGISPTVLPEGANVSVNNQTGTAPWAASGAQQSQHMMSLAGIGSELFTVCLVTCYSEGEESIRGTIESVAATNYPDTRKLIWVVCDGMITGAGETQSTPDICVGMLEADPRFGNPQPMGYIAVGSGAKHENRAMVYAGHYCESSQPQPY
jgi:chitin synthase